MDNALQPEIVLDHICKLGEGPVWDAASNSILWLDILKGEIHQFNTNTKQHSTFATGQMIGCIVPREQGGFIAGLENGIGFIDIEKKEVKHIIHPEEGLNNRFNDGKGDAAGRFWLGSMSKTEEENMGNFYMVDTDLSIHKKLENVSISNGLAWNADNTILYYINTPTNYIFAFDFDIETGAIDNQRVVVDLTHEKGFADGMTIDEEGMLWVAFYDGWRVARYNPATGDLLQQIDLPVANVTCCTFGGAGLTDLYITTASKNMSNEALEQQPHAGKLFVVKNTGIKGTSSKKFKA
ncbi:SMP-30/gluconolactonase/LRE family protein [Parafilimonas terrae]|uniref:Regucalcin n=1 Tax=Parafilimonas terrae TaxID=1465490 RepID=A0A1I5ZFK1_9BACT|nr:SMP-30/gluconolactonase/LRE family protein [Parafilimonas terrae]SFQ55215.1 Sugar lactone lactonase YvrE [Parafilimonas terrae]